MRLEGFMGILREIFGPSRAEIWSELSNQIDAQYIESGFFKTDKVVARIKDWTVTLDTYTVSNGKSSTTYTRLRAPYINPDGFRFKIYPKSIFSEIGKIFNLQDIIIGDPEFDERYIIKGTDEYKVRQLFSNTKLQEMIQADPYFHLEVKDDEGIFSAHFPEGVDELYFQVTGVIRDIERLKNLYYIYGEVLNQLCIIGSAYEGDPNVDL
jgi:hypothetical protein